MPRLIVLLVLVLSGCASPRAVLVNDKGEYVTCATTSVGIIGSAIAQHNYESCVADAKGKGYKIESEQK